MSANDPDASRAAAEALRDRRLLSDAAAAYAAHLRRHVGDRAGWIAYGACMAELGDPNTALLLWREAERLAPPDPGLLQRIGNALAALGRSEDAAIAWAQALTLDPAQEAARQSLIGADPEAVLRAGNAVVPAAPPPPMPAMLFDVSDLFDYWSQGNRLPTGIQRVQIEVARAAFARGDGASATVVFDVAAGGWRRLPRQHFLDLASAAGDGGDAAEPGWRLAVAAARAALEPAELPRDATLINLGTSWWVPDYMRRVQEAKRRHGLRYVAFLHDCIPLVLPEHCVAALVDEFARWFAGLCVTADLVICNSRSTEADFGRLRSALAPEAAAPVRVVPLDAAPMPSGQAPAPGRPYVLCVGTIESRKNHLMLFGAWLALLRRHGAEAVPDLICVGKRGWLAEAALALHANAPALRERVRLRHTVTDAELAALYAGCLFTVQNSHYEGWGLPVTESLGHGKVALLPDHSGYRESGAGGAVFFAPGSEPDLVAKLEALIFDAGHREDLERRLARAVRLRDWPAVADAILVAAAEAAVEAAPAPAINLALGDRLALRLLPGPIPSLRMALADAVREGEGWHTLEDWGVWTRPGLAQLRLPLGFGTAAPLRLFIELRGANAPVALSFRTGGRWHRIPVPAGATTSILADPPSDFGDGLSVEFDSGDGATLDNGRRVGVGVVALMLCQRDDLAARLDWVEAQLLPNPAHAAG